MFKMSVNASGKLGLLHRNLTTSMEQQTSLAPSAKDRHGERSKQSHSSPPQTDRPLSLGMEAIMNAFDTQILADKNNEPVSPEADCALLTKLLVSRYATNNKSAEVRPALSPIQDDEDIDLDKVEQDGLSTTTELQSMFEKLNASMDAKLNAISATTERLITSPTTSTPPSSPLKEQVQRSPRQQPLVNSSGTSRDGDGESCAATIIRERTYTKWSREEDNTSSTSNNSTSTTSTVASTPSTAQPAPITLDEEGYGFGSSSEDSDELEEDSDDARLDSKSGITSTNKSGCISTRSTRMKSSPTMVVPATTTKEGGKITTKRLNRLAAAERTPPRTPLTQARNEVRRRLLPAPQQQQQQQRKMKSSVTSVTHTTTSSKSPTTGVSPELLRNTNTKRATFKPPARPNSLLELYPNQLEALHNQQRQQQPSCNTGKSTTKDNSNQIYEEVDLASLLECRGVDDNSSPGEFKEKKSPFQRQASNRRSLHPPDDVTKLTYYATSKTPKVALESLAKSQNLSSEDVDDLTARLTSTRKDDSVDNDVVEEEVWVESTITAVRRLGQRIGLGVASQGEGFVTLTSIDPKGAAIKAGLDAKVGDRLVSIDGEPLGPGDHSRAAYLLASVAAGTPTSITLSQKKVQRRRRRPNQDPSSTRARTFTPRKVTKRGTETERKPVLSTIESISSISSLTTIGSVESWETMGEIGCFGLVACFDAAACDILYNESSGIKPKNSDERVQQNSTTPNNRAVKKQLNTVEAVADFISEFDTAVCLVTHRKTINFHSGIDHRFSYACNLTSKKLWDNQLKLWGACTNL